ncbi:MAG: MBL fold metallo-hydrolase [Candidatus Dormibacteraeota bacterium]|nr:MBL fold metallo-hydrolase [Candidatus Dormibacteraeota bacterium]
MTQHVVWDRGIALVEHGLWLDPPVIRDLAFVSHAHSDHARRHRLALLTAGTLALAAPGRKPRGARVVGLGVPAEVGGATITLHEAGHMLGSAQLVVEHRGSRLLYTGDLKLRLSGGASTAIPGADVLVLESTYGRPHFRFPDPDTVAEDVARWCWQAISAGVTPVLLAHALGKAQELMLLLGRFGLRFALEERCVPFARGYEAAGVTLPEWDELSTVEAATGDRVVILPPTGKVALRRLARYRTALVSGWAQDPQFWRIFGADRAFPLSDHCDFDELVEVVERSGARQVYTVHGFTDDLARHLRRRGFQAHPLDAVEQMALALG